MTVCLMIGLACVADRYCLTILGPVPLEMVRAGQWEPVDYPKGALLSKEFLANMRKRVSFYEGYGLRPCAEWEKNRVAGRRKVVLLFRVDGEAALS